MTEKQEAWTIGSLLRWTGQYFGGKGVDNPRLDAEVLLCHVLGKERIYLYTHYDQPLSKQELATYRVMVKHRAQRVPVAYITGRREFMGLDFGVAPAVLIPRPETELLVEAAQQRLQDMAAPHLLDLGTGSGAILVSLLYLLPKATGVAVDISPAALAIARENGERHGVTARLEMVEGDLFQPLGNSCRFDAIVSNPPYIPDADVDLLAPEVQQEPRGALAGGVDGLDFYRRIIAQGPAFLRSKGWLFLEVGIHQATAVAALADPAVWESAEIIDDYARIPRVVILQLRQ